MNIEKYTKLHDELMKRLERGEITTEQAKEINDLAFNKYITESYDIKIYNNEYRNSKDISDNSIIKQIKKINLPIKKFTIYFPISEIIEDLNNAIDTFNSNKTKILNEFIDRLKADINKMSYDVENDGTSPQRNTINNFIKSLSVNKLGKFEICITKSKDNKINISIFCDIDLPERSKIYGTDSWYISVVDGEIVDFSYYR